MKKELKEWFPGVVAFRNRIVNHLAHYRFKGKSAEEVFQIIYKENHWQDSESKSGTGSSHRSTVEVVNIVNQVISNLNINSILDVPCGDFNWMREVNLKGVIYRGADIVDDIVNTNQRLYSTNTISFNKLDILTSRFPKVDLIFTRDCLVHFSYEDIGRAIATIKNSGSTYWMTTTFPSHKNYDIITGDWRPVNLEASPFRLPKPIFIYNENCVEDERYLDKSLAIWKVSDI